MTMILLATGNRTKQAKLRWLTDGLGFTTVSPRDLGLTFEAPEDGESHRAVAAAKALAWAEHAGMLVIVSDGGAHIPALGQSWNSVRTRRAAGEDSDDCARADHLLGLMRGKVGGERSITWIEAVAVARPGELIGAWEATGAIGQLVESYNSVQIKDDFWFPALLRVPRFGKLVAELSPDEAAQLDDGWNGLYRVVRPHLAELATNG